MQLKTSRVATTGEVSVSCPFHTDNTPSLSINIDKGVFHCFSCHRSGSIEKLYKEYSGGRSLYNALGLSFNDFERLATIPPPVEDSFEELPYDKIVVEYDAARLSSARHNPLAKGYLRKRGITFAVLDRHRIRFSEQIYINKRRYDNVLVAPIFEGGHLISVELRDVTGTARKKVLYPPGTSVNTLYDIDNLSKDKPLYVVEGLMDLLVLRKYAQLQNSTTVFGASITRRQKFLLQQFDEVVYIPDNDDAGERTLQWMASNKMTNVSVLRVPEGLDGVPMKDVGDVEQKSTVLIGGLLKKKWLQHTTRLIIE